MDIANNILFGITTFRPHGLIITSCLMVMILMISGFFPGSSLSGNYVFAQSTVAKLGSLVSDTDNTIFYNTYENPQVGISLKYPSNMLIDESQSNDTLKIVSFFPSDPESSSYPDTFLLGFDVFVQKLDPLAYPANTTLSTYLENQVNMIQSSDDDVTIIDYNAGATLSGQPAYKLITKSFDDYNSPIMDVEIGTIHGGKLYSINYQINSSNYENSLPVINKITSSFKILSKISFNPFQILSNSSSFSEIKNQVPLLSDLFSFFNSNKSSTNLNSSIIKSIDKIFKNTTSQIKSSFLSPSSSSSSSQNTSMPSSFSSLPLSGMAVIEKICSLPLVSKLCGVDGNHTAGTNDHLSALPSNLFGLNAFTDSSNSSNGNTDRLLNGLMMNVLTMMNPSASTSGENNSNASGLSNLNDMTNLFGLLSSSHSSSHDLSSHDAKLNESMNLGSNLHINNNNSSGFKINKDLFGFLNELNKLQQ